MKRNVFPDIFTGEDKLVRPQVGTTWTVDTIACLRAMDGSSTAQNTLKVKELQFDLDRSSFH